MDTSIIERLEKRSDHVLELLVRLESRLETAGVLPKDEYTDDVLRFALEHNVAYDPKLGHGGKITEEYQELVADWLEKHEDNPEASFVQLELEFGHPDRAKLMNTLQFFYLREMWTEIIEQLEKSGHPVFPGQLTANPYRDPKPTKKFALPLT